MYHPSTQELEEMNFKFNPAGCFYEHGVETGPFSVHITKWDNHWAIDFRGENRIIHPTSKEQILTLINLFTPQ